MFEEILSGIVVVIIIGIFKYYFFFEISKINIRFLGVNPHIEPQRDGISKASWTGKLELYNTSDVMVTDLEIISEESNNPFINKFSELHVLRGSERKVIVSNEIVKLLSDNERRKIINNLSTYLPDEFINLKFIFIYKNVQGRRCYIKYIKEYDKESVSYHRFKPSFVKSIKE